VDISPDLPKIGSAKIRPLFIQFDPYVIVSSACRFDVSSSSLLIKMIILGCAYFADNLDKRDLKKSPRRPWRKQT